MTKISNIYVCSNCDAQSIKWSGRCLECGGWGTLQMQTINQKEVDKKNNTASPAKIINFNEIEEKNLERLKTNISEIDRVLGGGIVPGSLILLSGEPGIGKSTIVAQITSAVNKNIIYASGEESATQVKSRLNRLKCDFNTPDGGLKFIGETDVDKIISAVKKEKPNLVIIDSIQTVYTSVIQGEAGNINQIRACAVKFLEIAKQDNISIILIGHITKDGTIAGPKSLEHIVDAVIHLESEKTHDFRILRATKNRFGSTNEIGIFEMTSEGFKEIINPSSIFIEKDNEKISGSVVSSVIEGTRPFFIEIQALVTKTIFGYPQRKASGFDLNRLQVLTAVLTKRAGVNLTNQDVILNIVGGLKINDPSLDLAICLAITSSLLNQVINKKTIVLGEVGLGGEVRKISKLEQRLAEAEKLGFTNAIIPDCEVKNGNIKLKKVKNVKEIIF